MKIFTVSWKIEVEAENFEEAAYIAKTVQLDKESGANSFIITDPETDDSYGITIEFSDDDNKTFH